MSEVKHIKVDNWGIYFLQRLKVFFNRTDYCDLTLQFRDYAQLKVHRLVLSACTKYFEVLERTCETYDDCLVMPDDLQADVVLPIVNFMYTGQLEYDYGLYDRLYSTAQIMNLTVLTKLLDAQKTPHKEKPERKEMVVMNDRIDDRYYSRPSTSEGVGHSKPSGRTYAPAPGARPLGAGARSGNARPTRYELPEGLDGDDIFDTSFTDISYENSPIIRPLKRCNSAENRSPGIYDEGSSSRKFEELKKTLSNKRPRITLELPESRHLDYDQQGAPSDDDDDDNNGDSFASTDYQRSSPATSHRDRSNDFNHVNKYQTSSSHETVKSEKSAHLNHAKIIHEVLKKYPHLVKSNKNIKLKIMTDKESKVSQNYVIGPNKDIYSQPPSSTHKTQPKDDANAPDWIYVSRNANAESIANLVALGTENTTGPWLCLICGTPSKALKFLTYHKYYRHLIDHHKEKVPPKICEYCGFKSGKRNHLLHHMYTKHDIDPPPNYHFPKCSQCSYVALTEAFLIKHKLSHIDAKDFTCSVCNSSFKTRPQLLVHIQSSGHKISPDRRISTKCAYCNKVFLREANLYTHLKVSHKEIARSDGIIDNSDEEDDKYMQSAPLYNYTQQEEHVEIKEEYDGKIQIISNTQVNKPFAKPSQKILNTGVLVKNKERQDYEQPSRAMYSKMDHPRVVESDDRGSKNDTLGSVGRSIATSINLVDVVVLNENEYVLHNEEDTHNDNNLQEEHVQNETEVEEEPKSKINNTKQIQRTNQEVHNSQSQPLQIVVSGHQSYKTSTLSSPRVDDQNQAENEQVMVLNEEEFQIACSQSLTNNASNIVLVYSHPVDNKEYIQIGDQQYQTVESQDPVETQLEQIHEDGDQITMPEQALVQETVETWQEEIVEHSMDSQGNVEDGIVVEEQVRMDDGEGVEVIQEEDGVPIETSEVTISSSENDNDVDKKEENPCEDNELPVIDTQTEHCEDVVMRECEESVVENGSSATDDNDSHNYAMQNKETEEEPTSEPVVEDSTKDPEWSENIHPDKFTEPDAKSEIQTESRSAQTDITDEPEYEEEEESIENIQKEIKQQTSEQAVIAEDATESEPQKGGDGEVEKEVENDVLENDESPNKNCENNNEEKTKCVEKISNLINEWDDNDSQSETVTVTETKEPEVVQSKDSNIDKLVSDWDDDDEK